MLGSLLLKHSQFVYGGYDTFTLPLARYISELNFILDAALLKPFYFLVEKLNGLRLVLTFDESYEVRF